MLLIFGVVADRHVQARRGGQYVIEYLPDGLRCRCVRRQTARAYQCAPRRCSPIVIFLLSDADFSEVTCGAGYMAKSFLMITPFSPHLISKSEHGIP
jgi:hypothetical protein